MSFYLEDLKTEKKEEFDSEEEFYEFSEGPDFISSKFFDFLISGAEAVDYCERLNVSKSILNSKCLASLDAQKSLKEEAFNKINFNVDGGIFLNLNSCILKTPEENLDEHCLSQGTFSEKFYKKLNLGNDKIREVLDNDSGSSGPPNFILNIDDTKDYYIEKKSSVDEFFTEIDELFTMLPEEECESSDEEDKFKIVEKLNIKTGKKISIVTQDYDFESNIVQRNDSDSSYEKSMEAFKDDIADFIEVGTKQGQISKAKGGEKWAKSQKGKKKFSKYKGEQKNSEGVSGSDKSKKTFSKYEDKQKNSEGVSGSDKSEYCEQSDKTVNKNHRREKDETSKGPFKEQMVRGKFSSKSNLTRDKPSEIDKQINDHNFQVPLSLTQVSSSTLENKKPARPIRDDGTQGDLFEKLLGSSKSGSLKENSGFQTNTNEKNNLVSQDPLVETSKVSSTTEVKRKQVKSIKKDSSSDDLFEKSLGKKSFLAKIAVKK